MGESLEVRQEPLTGAAFGIVCVCLGKRRLVASSELACAKLRTLLAGLLWTFPIYSGRVTFMHLNALVCQGKPIEDILTFPSISPPRGEGVWQGSSVTSFIQLEQHFYRPIIFQEPVQRLHSSQPIRSLFRSRRTFLVTFIRRELISVWLLIFLVGEDAYT